MGIDFGNIGLDDELGEFRVSIEEINMESVKKRTAKEFANEMAEQVRLAVVAEDDITSPAMNSIYDRGPGPSMASRNAWQVNSMGSNGYRVTPHPQVEKRAAILNYGSDGPITPDGDKPFEIMIDGHPIYRWAVSGVPETNYWSAAMRNLEASGKIEQIAEKELRAEIEESF